MDFAIRDRLIIDWREASTVLALAKEIEAKARAALVTYFYPAGMATIPEGVNNTELGQGYTLKITGKVTYSVGKDIDRVKQVAATMTQMGPTAPLIVERLFKWSPEVSATEYKLLKAGHAKFQLEGNANYLTESHIYKALGDFLTIKPAATTVELAVPKAKL